jgi:hypothetical protein
VNVSDHHEYQSGVEAGKVLERLDSHDRHFSLINGNLVRLADEMHAMVLQVQRLGDSANADRATVKVTAEALKEAKEASDTASQRQWSPFQRGIAVIGGLAAIGAIIAEIVSRFH